MANVTPWTAAAPARAAESVQSASMPVPWYIWSSSVAVTSALVGGYWDISWHMSIGRDTFWTPAHMAIYLCGVLAGVTSGVLILSATFDHGTAERQCTVRVWGFRGPLGAFMAAWGGLAMLASAPFDNWWHNAYGLDVKIVSPPHLVLDSGVLAIDVGTLILVLAAMNRAQGKLRERLNGFFLYIGGMLILLFSIVSAEYTGRSLMHSAICYRTVAMTMPLVLVGISRASGSRWGATLMAGVYTAACLGQLWILPLFPAQPKLGPVYQRVTHFIPMEFPLLLIVPAILMDLTLARMSERNKWVQATVAGSTFLVSFVAVQWPFADFLMSPASRSWVFGTAYLEYFIRPTSLYARHLFYSWERTRIEFLAAMVLAWVLAVISSRIGLAAGEWMRQVRR